MDTILHWHEIKRLRNPNEHEAEFTHDGGPPGGYVPNMSEEDMRRWKAKIVGRLTSSPQVEIRKTLGGSQLLIIVALDGYRYKHSTPENTKGLNIHMSANGPLQMTFNDMDELNRAVAEVREKLESMVKKPA